MSARLLVLTLAALAATARPAAGQDIAPLALDSLITPASPALILLGAAPVVIERPSTPKAVALSLASAISEADGIPEDLALEFAPYWLTGHPSLTFDDYYRAGLAQRLLQTLSISLGTSRLDPPTADAEAGTAVAFGFRSSPVSGAPNPALQDAVDSLSRIQVAFTREAIDLESDEEIQAHAASSTSARSRDRWSSSSTWATSCPAVSRRPTAWRPTWSTGWERAPPSRSPSGGTTSRRTGPTRASSRGSR
jgi:hypothetical protein